MKVILAGFSANVIEALINNKHNDTEILKSVELLEDSPRAVEEAKSMGLQDNQIHSFDWLTAKKYEHVGAPELINCVASKPQIRRHIYMKLKKLPLARFRSIRNTNNLISNNSIIESGSFINKLVTIEAFCEVGKQAFVNSHSHIGHNSILKENVIIGGGVIVNGYCNIGSNTLLGSGVIVNNKVRIGDNCLIQAGSIVLTHIPSDSYVAGNPAKVICSAKLFTRFAS